jgi:hypothetical protein
MFGKHLRLRWFLGGIAVTAAIAVVGAPLANATRSHALACREDPGHWVNVTDDQGVPALELVGTIICTDVVSGQACALASQSTQRSPYPGWVQATDDVGVPWLDKIGYASTSSADCVQADAAESTTAGTTAPASPQTSLPPMTSPYPGWAVVLDDQGVSWLEPIQQFR